jgi:hypothetical protein
LLCYIEGYGSGLRIYTWTVVHTKKRGKKWNSMDESRQFEIERGCERYMKRDVHILLKCSERKEWRERFLNSKCTRLNENQGYKMVSTATRKKM